MASIVAHLNSFQLANDRKSTHLHHKSTLTWNEIEWERKKNYPSLKCTQTDSRSFRQQIQFPRAIFSPVACPPLLSPYHIDNCVVNRHPSRLNVTFNCPRGLHFTYVGTLSLPSAVVADLTRPPVCGRSSSDLVLSKILYQRTCPLWHLHRRRALVTI